MLLVEYSILDNVKVINESKNGVTKLKLLGKFQKCDEQNNNGRVYPRSILESQVKAIQGKIDERSLVGALDHPANDAIHLSQASHLITKLWVEKNGDVMGEAEILSTPNGKIVEALIGDGVKIGISSRGLGSVSENSEGKIVNEDFKLITFDLVSDPSTKGAFPEMCESMRENSQRAQTIISKHKKDRVLMTMLESKIKEALGKVSEEESDRVKDNKAVRSLGFGATTVPDKPTQGRTHSFRGTTVKGNKPKDRKAQLAANPPKRKGKFKTDNIDKEAKTLAAGGEEDHRGLKTRDDSSTNLRNSIVNRIKEALRVNKPSALDNAMGGAPKVPTLKRKPVDKNAAIRNLNKEMGARAQKEIDDRRRGAEARNRGESPN
tara:strand:+ start:674 stop:1807 length:1134 start_codon:yes stop_codon:yes gene_type:complete